MAIINGVGRVGVRVTSSPAPSSSYLLDTYSGSVGAYSLRKLSSTYSGSAIRVRRSSDNTEMNIGFVGESLDTTTLTTFVGAGNGFVTNWYDQSGNGYNLTQATAANQPRIVNSGSLETINSLPSVNFLTNTWLSSNASITTMSVFTVSKVTTYTQLQSLFGFWGGYTNGPWVRSIGTNYYRTPSTGGANTDDFTNSNYMYFNDSLHSTSQSFLNPHILSSFGNTPNKFELSTRFYGRQYIGLISEAILYSTDKRTTDKTGINTQMNTYYGIYTPLDSDASAFITAASLTDSTQISAVNTLVTGLKSAGLWTKMSAIYPFVGGNATAHSKNLKNTSLYNLTFSSGWTHTSTGALPNGTSGYIDSNLSPSQTTYTDFSYGDYIRTNSDGVYAEFGMSNGNIYIYPRLGNTSYTRYASSENSSSSTDSRGFEVLTQKSGILNYYKNTTQLVNVSNIPSDLSGNTNNYFMSARNVSGSAAQFSNREKSFAFFGSGLLSAEVTTLYTLVQAFQTTLGRNV